LHKVVKPSTTPPSRAIGLIGVCTGVRNVANLPLMPGAEVKWGRLVDMQKIWKQAEDIGASFPTYVIGDKKVCNQQFFDGFEWINCGFSVD